MNWCGLSFQTCLVSVGSWKKKIYWLFYRKNYWSIKYVMTWDKKNYVSFHAKPPRQTLIEYYRERYSNRSNQNSVCNFCIIFSFLGLHNLFQFRWSCYKSFFTWLWLKLYFGFKWVVTVLYNHSNLAKYSKFVIKE